MHYRPAQINDIPQLHAIRISVKENPLPDPDLIMRDEYENFLIRRGKGWVCEIENQIVGFAIVDLTEHNIWALFIQPGFEKKGIGKKLQDEMLTWYFSKTDETIWLGTAPKTRAEEFYRRTGWKETGKRPNGEIRFEMTAHDWINRHS
jgi:GNAT superfamily N-acetyltransferase